MWLMDKNVNYPLKQSVNNHCLDTGLNPTRTYPARGGYARQSTYKVVEKWLTNYLSKLVLGGLVSLA